MSKIIVTGGNGQLATCIKKESKSSDHTFIFIDGNTLDIADGHSVNSLFENERPDFCINCAAYTAVDKAESEPDKAALVNVDGARNLAMACREHNVKLFHISTDFVFDGRKKTPYTEEDVPNPLGVYGCTKLAGEKAVIDNLKESIILRTAWLYSAQGTNFLKTMLRLGHEREVLSVVSDQIGTPTYAGDLAKLVIALINKNTVKYGIYHYSNSGSATWYDFALAIFEIANIKCDLVPIKTSEYPTAAKRPGYSVLDKAKIKAAFQIQIPEWKDSLIECLSELKNQ